jgi:hypothetical protein
MAGLALGFVATTALARDYVVVSSTSAGITRGQSLEAGLRIALPPGQTLTLMHASGDIVRLRGAAGGVVLPRRAASKGEADRLAVLKLMVAPAASEKVGGVGERRTRSGICPEAARILTLDAIVQTYQAGCKSQATQALETWIESRPPVDES